ncbi:MAG: DNA topoisomerase, partial [Pyrodictiaceae archaeon]
VITKEIERYSKVIFPGFLEVYMPIKIEGELRSGVYKPKRIIPRVRSMIAPLTQADAIRLMKERNIGRPSTYAKIIDTLLRRAYAVSKARGMLLATNRGIKAYEFLMKYFSGLLSEEVTRKLQETMDMIEKGEEDYQRVLENIWHEIEESLTRYYKVR